MPETELLTDHFLIAMPSLADPNFAQTVTYICEHNREGAMGIVINRPLDLTMAEVMNHMAIEPVAGLHTTLPVYSGGPVQPERGFVLHSPVGGWDSSLGITADTAVTTSRDIIAAIARGEGPKRFLLALGYAGWGAGQLEQEMAENAWLSGPADPAIIFDAPPEARWRQAAALLGVDLNLLSAEVGHA